MFEISLTPEDLWATAQVLGVAWLLFAVHWYWNWKVYKKIGPHKSPMYGDLIDNGCHGTTYGSIVGVVYIVAVGLTCVIFWRLGIANMPPFNTLFVGTVINYIFAAVILELWGRHFLKKHGLNPTDKVAERILRKKEEKRQRKREKEEKARQQNTARSGRSQRTDASHPSTHRKRKLKLSPKQKKKLNQVWEKHK